MARFRWMFGVIVSAFCFASAAVADETVGVVKFVSEPEGATVSVDGRIRGVTPLLLELAAGPHAVLLSMNGYPPKKKHLTVLSGRISVSRFVFDDTLPKNTIRVHDMKAGGLDSGPGTVAIITDPPGLTVRMNKQTVSRVTPVSFDIHSGIYKLQIMQRDTVLLEKTVVVYAGRSLELEYSVRKRRTIDETDPWQ